MPSTLKVVQEEARRLGYVTTPPEIRWDVANGRGGIRMCFSLDGELLRTEPCLVLAGQPTGSPEQTNIDWALSILLAHGADIQPTNTHHMNQLRANRPPTSYDYYLTRAEYEAWRNTPRPAPQQPPSRRPRWRKALPYCCGAVVLLAGWGAILSQFIGLATTIALLWVIYSPLTYAIAFAHFQGEYPQLAQQNYWGDIVFSISLSLVGPGSLLIAFVSSGFAKHGLKWR